MKLTMPKVKKNDTPPTDTRPAVGISLSLRSWDEVFDDVGNFRPDPVPVELPPAGRDSRGRFIRYHAPRPDRRRRTVPDGMPAPWKEGETTETPFLSKFTGAPYPEHIAKSDNTGLPAGATRPFNGCVATVTADPAGGTTSPNPAADYRRAVETPQYLPRCATIAISGGCGNGHRHLKAVVCGREWCPDCGRPGSMAHRRRVSRWWKRVHGMDSVGYLVISLPLNLAETYYNTQEKLNEFRTYIRRKLKRTDLSGDSTERVTRYQYTTKTGKVRRGCRREFIGYNRGLIRWHYAGDCKGCRGRGCDRCEFTGAGETWHPHLNILVPDGRVTKRALKQFRADVQAYLRKLHGDDEITAVVHYQYSTKPGKKTHLLKYVTRATLRIFDKDRAEMLHGYRSTSIWGRYPPEQRAATFTQAGEHGVCLHCLHGTGEIVKIQWGAKLTGREFYRVVNAYGHRGNGYYTGFIRDGMVSPL